MRTCRNCGVSLPDETQYCMQCGTAVDSEAAAPTQLPAARFLGPAILSGTVMGILASLPLVNCLCCAWVAGGGAVSAWLVGKRLPNRINGMSLGDGAFAGVLSGVWGALVATVVYIPLRLISAEAIRAQQAEIEQLLNEYPDLVEPAREILLTLVSPDLSFLTILLTLMANLLLYGLLAMLGGIIFVAAVRKPGDASGPGTRG